MKFLIGGRYLNQGNQALYLVYDSTKPMAEWITHAQFMGLLCRQKNPFKNVAQAPYGAVFTWTTGAPSTMFPGNPVYFIISGKKDSTGHVCSYKVCQLGDPLPQEISASTIQDVLKGQIVNAYFAYRNDQLVLLGNKWRIPYKQVD